MEGVVIAKFILAVTIDVPPFYMNTKMRKMRRSQRGNAK